MQNPDKLREWAAWYREFAERAGNPALREGRLRMAEDLDDETERIERGLAAHLDETTTVVTRRAPLSVFCNPIRPSEPAGTIAMPSDLHRAVRQAYRHAMAQQKTQREAFHLAMDRVLEREPQADRADARRIVAIMLANEPELSARDAARQPG